MTRNEKSLRALFSNTEIIKSSTGTIHCVYLSDITPTEWTKDMALAAIKNSVTNYGYYEYNGKKGLCIVGDFEDIYNFIESTGYVVDEDNLYHWKEFPWDNAKKLDTVQSSHRPIKSETDDFIKRAVNFGQRNGLNIPELALAFSDGRRCSYEDYLKLCKWFKNQENVDRYYSGVELN